MTAIATKTDWTVCDSFVYPEPQPICDWVETHVRFSSKVSSVAGFWSHSAFPYSRGVLEALADERISEVVCQWGTQLGKTSILGAYLAWVAHQDPKPALIACPDERSADEHQKTKLIPMLEAVDGLRAKLPPPRKRKKTLLDLGDQVIYYAWSGARWSVSGRSAAVVCITEVNLHTRDASSDGDPVEMARDRTKGFANYKIYVEGKAGTQGECRLEKSYLDSDQRTFHLPCPHCDTYQPLEFGSRESDHGLKWETNEKGEVLDDSVYYQCGTCKGKIYDRHKPRMLSRGVWCPKGQRVEDGRLVGVPDRRPRVAGFKLSSLYSLLIPWPDFVRKFLACKRESVEALKNFVQAWLAETWQVQGRRAGLEEILEHKGSYRLGTVPGPALALIATVDVQQDGLWYVIRAWSYGATSWLIRYGYLTDFAALKTILTDSYRGPQGECYALTDCWIDSGYRTQEVYAFCRENGCKPIKGAHQYRQAGLLAQLKVPEWGLIGWHIDKGQACDQFYDKRLTVRRGDPGFWEYAEDVDGTYLRGLLAWERQEEADKYGRKRSIWVSKSPEYEHLGDCETYQEAAARLGDFQYKQPPEEAKGKVVQVATVKRRDGRGWYER